MKTNIALLAVAACVISGASAGATIAGATLEPTLTVGGRTLTLVSCGVRDTMWIDHYAAGLYVPEGEGPEAVKDPQRAKAVRMKVIQAQYLPDNIPERWRGALNDELRREPMARVRRAYDRISAGDVITFTYVPGEGATMRVNGNVVIRSEGHEVIDSILSAWAERDPIGDKLQRVKLEHPC